MERGKGEGGMCAAERELSWWYDSWEMCMVKEAMLEVGERAQGRVVGVRDCGGFCGCCG